MAARTVESLGLAVGNAALAHGFGEVLGFTLGTAVRVHGFGEVLGLAVGKAEIVHGFVEFFGLAFSHADIVHGAGGGGSRGKKLSPAQGKNQGPPPMQIVIF